MNICQLGRMDFLPAWDVQRSLFKKHTEASKMGLSSPNTLLLVEHNPVYTIGIRKRAYSQSDEAKLRKLGADFCYTNRGGLITFHGPGQLVAYPVINLKDFRTGLRNYICGLEKTVIKMCADFSIEAATTSDTGVWVQDRKIAAIGKFKGCR